MGNFQCRPFSCKSNGDFWLIQHQFVLNHAVFDVCANFGWVKKRVIIFQIPLIIFRIRRNTENSTPTYLELMTFACCTALSRLHASTDEIGVVVGVDGVVFICFEPQPFRDSTGTRATITDVKFGIKLDSSMYSKLSSKQSKLQQKITNSITVKML